MASRHIAFVSSMSAMSKPCTSVVDEPRPVPNSKRLPVRWSSSATFSATRTGLFTGGVMLKIAEPRWTRSVCAAQKERNASGPGMCEYSSRKWCCGHHTYLKPDRSARAGDLDVAHDALVLGRRVGLTLELRDEQLGEDSELHARNCNTF